MKNYDDVYRRPEFYWGKEPNSLCREVLSLIPETEMRSAKIIDLGSGEGKDIIHFAKNGLNATGVEISTPGIKKASAWAKEEGVDIRTLQEDISRFRLTEPFDVVYSSGTLTFITPDLREGAFQNYKENTKSGGINAFNVFVEKPFLMTPPDWGDDEFFFKSGELLLHYWDWEIIKFSEDIFDCGSGGIEHRHAMDTLIARKI